ncbi:hypothetical protein AWC31_16375 [Mycolicibacterium wolinskyi]|uniref:Uncharacterized protein n=1 Tax=Mycolicibacterium wolinskyi TaxID=59750 RepID=A0A1X2FHR0_9MYCO|nr:hypothetical protein AWC31_16375 [Mycolicibacterium wolinskyi]
MIPKKKRPISSREIFYFRLLIMASLSKPANLVDKLSGHSRNRRTLLQVSSLVGYREMGTLVVISSTT